MKLWGRRAALGRRARVLLAACLLGGGALPAAAQEPPAPPLNGPREARFEWDAARRWLFVTLAFRDVADAGVLRKLKLGLPTTIVLTGILYAQGTEQPLASTLQNPWQLEETKGSLADDMRIKLLYDLAYTASLEKLSAYLSTELKIIFQTPIVMLRMASGR